MRKIIITILGMIFLIGLVSAQNINLDGNNYEITNHSYFEGIGYCLDFKGIDDKSPCSTYINETNGELVFNENAMIDLNYTVYCWTNECTPEMYPFYNPEDNIINNSGNIIIADDFLVGSRIYTGDSIDEILNMTTTPTTSNKYEEIEHDGVPYGFSWLLKAIKDIVNRLTGAEDKINRLEEELCRKDNTYSFCLGGVTP